MKNEQNKHEETLKNYNENEEKTKTVSGLVPSCGNWCAQTSNWLKALVSSRMHRRWPPEFLGENCLWSRGRIVFLWSHFGSSLEQFFFWIWTSESWEFLDKKRIELLFFIWIWRSDLESSKKNNQIRKIIWRFESDFKNHMVSFWTLRFFLPDHWPTVSCAPVRRPQAATTALGRAEEHHALARVNGEAAVRHQPAFGDGGPVGGFFRLPWKDWEWNCCCVLLKKDPLKKKMVSETPIISHL